MMSIDSDAIKDPGPVGAPANELPYPLPDPPPVPEPADVPYPGGVLSLDVDATDVERRILRARLNIPVAATAELVLLYPKWLPGFHSPEAPIELLAGLEIKAGADLLEWVRHPVAVNSFRILIPPGVDKIEATFQFLSPTSKNQGRVIMTEDLLMLPWHSVVMFPAGHFARRIELTVSLRLPSGWDHACALTVDRREHDVVHFRPTSLDFLVDSPLLAGAHMRTYDLDESGVVRLNVAADGPELLDIEPEHVAQHRAVVTQCDKLFGYRHFRHYDVLLALSEELSGSGIEHHQCCEAVSVPSYFTQWKSNFTRHSTFPHEYVHSWNGKHRRGADSWSPCFEKPIRNSLLWVYEGQTQYWTNILCARSGLWTRDQTLGAWAEIAATYDIRPGSRWRPLIDTTRDPIIAARNPLPWQSWQRSEDYYSEGALIWLDIDTRIRELTTGAKSLDDFARSFFGLDAGEPVTHTYDFEDVLSALDQIAPFHWKGLLSHLVTDTRNGAPLDGLARGGYELIYRDEPNLYSKGLTASSGVADHSFSIGLKVDGQGGVTDVLWEGPAFECGITVGSSILAVNGRSFSQDIMNAAVRSTAEGSPLRLIVRSGTRVREVMLEYRNGLRFPHLERIDHREATLDDILSPL